jgi:hypothetical protein
MLPAYLGVWRSLVACFVRDEEVAGSNPVTPTTRSPHTIPLVSTQNADQGRLPGSGGE